MSETGPPALPKDLALKGGENGQQRSHRTARRCGQVQRLGKRYEGDAEMLQFLQSREQVRYGSSPAVQPPHHNNVDISAPCRFQQFLPALPLCCSGADFFHLHGDGPAAPGSIFAHGAVLHGQRLLILSGDAGKRPTRTILAVFCPWPKTFPDFPMPDPCFTGISRGSPRMAADYPFRPYGTHHNSKGSRGSPQFAPESRDSSTASIPWDGRRVPGRGVATRSDSRRSWRRITGRYGSGS